MRLFSYFFRASFAWVLSALLLGCASPAMSIYPQEDALSRSRAT